MKLTLYTSDSDDNVIGKVYSNPLEVSITLRGNVDIVRPMIRLELDSNILGYNYCHITELDRFYFIRSVTSLSRSLWQLDLECDVLETYKTDIKASRARYLRNIRTGDYANVALDVSIAPTITAIESSKGFDGERTMILTTLGASDNG